MANLSKIFMAATAKGVALDPINIAISVDLMTVCIFGFMLWHAYTISDMTIHKKRY